MNDDMEFQEILVAKERLSAIVNTRLSEQAKERMKKELAVQFNEEKITPSVVSRTAMKKRFLSSVTAAMGILFAGLSIMIGVDRYRTTGESQNTIPRFLATYGWKADIGKSTHSNLVMPVSFSSKPNGYPLGLFWSYVNVLSSDIGFNLTSELGKPVTVFDVPLQNDWTSARPNTTEAIIVEYNGKIVGGWLRNGFTLGSLRGRFFGDIVHITWENWLSRNGVVTYTKRSNPEGVIRSFFSELHGQYYAEAASLLASGEQFALMTNNVHDRQLYQPNWLQANFFPRGTVVITNIKLLRTRQTTIRQSSIEFGDYQVNHMQLLVT